MLFVCPACQSVLAPTGSGGSASFLEMVVQITQQNVALLGCDALIPFVQGKCIYIREFTLLCCQHTLLDTCRMSAGCYHKSFCCPKLICGLPETACAGSQSTWLPRMCIHNTLKPFTQDSLIFLVLQQSACLIMYTCLSLAGLCATLTPLGVGPELTGLFNANPAANTCSFSCQ